MAYLDGELPIERAAAAAAHLERCQECQRLTGDIAVVSQRLLAWQIEASDQRVTHSVAAALDQGARQRHDAVAAGRRRWRNVLGMRRVSPWVWGLAGALMAVLLVPMLLWQPARMPAPPGLEASAPQALPRPVARAQAHVALPADGAPQAPEPQASGRS